MSFLPMIINDREPGGFAELPRRGGKWFKGRAVLQSDVAPLQEQGGAAPECLNEAAMSRRPGRAEPAGLSPSSARAAPPVPASMMEVRAAWIDFYDSHYSRVVLFVMHNGGSLDDAQDAAQEAFSESWTLLTSDPARWAAITNKMAWIRVVALRRYRRPPGPRRRPWLVLGAEVPDLPHPGPEMDELTAQAQMVLHALRSLDEEERAVMAFYLDGFRTADIAAALETGQQRVLDVKKKARSALRSALAGSGERRPR